MRKFALIGGSGLDRLAELDVRRTSRPATAYGAPSAPIVEGLLDGQAVCFLPRHGSDHGLPPHRINYRANVMALRALGVTDVIAVAAVGGIATDAGPGTIVIPDQLVDYTWGREHTFYDGANGELDHVDFTAPYAADLRAALVAAARTLGIAIVPQGTYAATQGPRLETAAEIRRLARDGCTIVGMTGMPEAALAREAGMAYANCSLVVNRAAGLGVGPITAEEMRRNLERGMGDVLRIVGTTLRQVRAVHRGHRSRPSLQ
ncbi:MAG: S-methyl-5'-thioinosine phosphorylase [Gammaproteobacteria bacterium]|nr:S-methyl-5'-thioinosine phosphorylase [Gammaproteobacteria bacterium]